MKLVEIKDIRPGQIRKVTAFNQWKDEEEFEVLAVIESSGLGEYAEFDTYAEFYDIKTKQLMEDDSEELRFYENGELIGKLGITHRTEDGKLVEIPRTAEFQIDDVVKFKWCDPRLYVINREIDFGIKESHPNNACFEATNDLYGSRQLVDFELKRVGILGVTHEFVNDREA